MSTRFLTTLPPRRMVVTLAGVIGLLLALLVTGTARAGGGCQITIEPSTIQAGGQFVVSGDFGIGAEVHLVPGKDVPPPEDSEPVYTAPSDASSFRATITMASDTQGTWTVWGFLPASECGDSAILTVTGTLPDAAMATDGGAASAALGVLLLALALAALALPRFTAATAPDLR